MFALPKWLTDIKALLASADGKILGRTSGAWSFSAITKATGAEVTTGTDDAKFATPKALADAGIKIQTPSVGSILYMYNNFGGF